jgi:hypothetical protein
MKIAYFDLTQGVSEEGLLGALLDLGVSPEGLIEELTKLDLDKFDIDVREDLKYFKKDKAKGVKLQSKQQVKLEKKEVSYTDIKELIITSQLAKKIKDRELSILNTLFKVKGKVPLWQVIEVLVFITCILSGIDLLGIEKIYSSSIQVEASPRVVILDILQGCKIFSNDCNYESISEIGALIVANLVEDFGEMPVMTLEKSGYGFRAAGNRERIETKIILGELETSDLYQRDKVIIIEANIDDMNQEFYEYIMERLLKAGALDVYLTPIQMKKNRPAQKLTVLTIDKDLSSVLDIIFNETTTLGVRLDRKERYKLDRKFATVEVESMKVEVKLGYRGEQILNIAPEYEACKRIAKDKGLSLKEVYQRAIMEYKKIDKHT